ncbi:Uu.00g063570.m01.CDS01 [Anthostomella pinea]|uniref:Uu.00g063570.m01.CDS01 n=1 Tax=Anthostomella pinea TaxID=933095 RepID=A0AAI8VTD2_9PEZI|nr:Uu.00g063570.m01.CDS01 [Anthostomella pinea]
MPSNGDHSPERESTPKSAKKQNEKIVDEEAKSERAARKRLRTGWRSGASESEKQRAIRLALNTQLPGGRKYSWLNQKPESVAETLGPEKARELGITTGKIAQELGIGEFQEAPTKLTIDFEGVRGAGFNMNKAELEAMIRDAGASDEQVEAVKKSNEPVLPTPRRPRTEKPSSPPPSAAPRRRAPKTKRSGEETTPVSAKKKQKTQEKQSTKPTERPTGDKVIEIVDLSDEQPFPASSAVSESSTLANPAHPAGKAARNYQSSNVVERLSCWKYQSFYHDHWV